MSAIIKSGDPRPQGRGGPGSQGGIVRALRDTRQTGPAIASPAQDDEQALLHERLRQLEELADAQRKAIERHRGELAEALEKGKAEGFKRGLAEAQTREHERLSLLREAMAKALAAFERNLTDAEAFAVLLAQTSLDKLFAGMHGNAETVCKLIKTQLQKAVDAQVLGIRVSGEDFPSAQALAELEQETAFRGSRIVQDAKLRSGECVMQLSLGEAEIGLAVQWESIRALLESWSPSREAALP